MSHRLQVLIPEELDLRLRKAARRSRMSKGQWVRQAIEVSLRHYGRDRASSDVMARLKSLRAPTADVGRMIREIERGGA